MRRIDPAQSKAFFAAHLWLALCREKGYRVSTVYNNVWHVHDGDRCVAKLQVDGTTMYADNAEFFERLL